VDGDTALISAPTDIPPRCASTGTHAGGVGTFTRATGTWVQKGTRLAPRGACQGSYGSDMARVTASGIVTVEIKPTPRVRRALSRHRSIVPKLHVTVHFRPHGGLAPAPQAYTAYLERG
jgi:hypothetical protein